MPKALFPMDGFPHFEKVAGSWKGSENERAFVELARREKTPELEANSELAKEEKLEKEENLVEEEKVVECLSGFPPTQHDTEEAAQPGSSSSPEREDMLMRGEPEEVEVCILEVFSNLPVSPIQKMEAATPRPDVPPIDLTQEQPSPSPLGVDVTAFQLSWKEVRKQRQMETVQKYKEKLQSEASFLFNQILLKRGSMFLTGRLRDPLEKKIRDYLGIFPI